MNAQEIREKVLPAMVLAPSAHNTQPWRFSVREGVVDVYLDQERHLAVSDPTGRQAYVSLGCAVLNGQVAAAANGFGTEINFFPEGEGDEAPAVRISWQGQADERLKTLRQAIDDRRTDRRDYDGEPLTSAERRSVPTLEDESVFPIEGEENLETVAKLTGQGTHQTLSRKDFKDELSHWVRNSWTKQPDGMPGYAMGMPALISLVSPVLMKIAPIHKQEQTNTAKQISNSSLAAVVVTPGDGKRDWLQAGIILEKLWLEAVAAGLSAGVLAAAVESGEEIRGQLKSSLNIPGVPQTVIRIGHGPGKELKATPRRSAEDCLVKEKTQ